MNLPLGNLSVMNTSVTGVRGTAPGVQGTAPGVRGTSPGVRGTAPDVRGIAPGVRGTAPGTAPGVQDTAPAAILQSSNSQWNRSASNFQTTAQYLNQSANNSQATSQQSVPQLLNFPFGQHASSSSASPFRTDSPFTHSSRGTPSSHMPGTSESRNSLLNNSPVSHNVDSLLNNAANANRVNSASPNVGTGNSNFAASFSRSQGVPHSMQHHGLQQTPPQMPVPSPSMQPMMQSGPTDSLHNWDFRSGLPLPSHRPIMSPTISNSAVSPNNQHLNPAWTAASSSEAVATTQTPARSVPTVTSTLSALYETAPQNLASRTVSNPSQHDHPQMAHSFSPSYSEALRALSHVVSSADITSTPSSTAVSSK